MYIWSVRVIPTYSVYRLYDILWTVKLPLFVVVGKCVDKFSRYFLPFWLMCNLLVGVVGVASA